MDMQAHLRLTWRGAAEVPPPPLIPTPQRQLYPPVGSTDSGTLQVTPLHSVYYRVYGNPEGPAALVVHGGPGAGCFDKHACVWPAAVPCAAEPQEPGEEQARRCLGGVWCMMIMTRAQSGTQRGV